MRPWQELAVEAEFRGSIAQYDAKLEAMLLDFSPPAVIVEDVLPVAYLWYYPGEVDPDLRLPLYFRDDLYPYWPGFPEYQAAMAAVLPRLDAAMAPSAHRRLELFRMGGSQ